MKQKYPPIFLLQINGLYSPQLTSLQAPLVASISTHALRSTKGTNQLVTNFYGNRTEWSPIWSVIKRVINKIGRLSNRSPSIIPNQLVDDTKFCYQYIITIIN